MGKRFKGKGALLLIILLGVFLPVFLLSCGGGGSSSNPPPPTVADFSADITTGPAPLTVAFTDNSTGGPTSWEWDFGDGSALNTNQNPSHPYAAAGTYDVTLTVDGPGGLDNVTKVGYITVTVLVPVAGFSALPLTGAAPLTVAFTDESTGGATSWDWAFGDGGTSTLQDPSHPYAAAGTYTVTLIATGPGGSDTETKPNYITVGAPPVAPVAGFSALPLTGAAPLTVAFTDESTGVISTWAWDFGDSGTSTLQNPSHDYATSGTYTVALTATGPGGSDPETKVGYINVTPLADFSADNTTGTAPLGVQFTDNSTGGATSWSWDFGDGSALNTNQDPSHTYAAAGTYTVSLIATGPGGSDTETKPNYITVGAPPVAPVAGFSALPLTGEVPLTVAFTDESTGVISTWAWDFGDSGTSALQNPSHDYVTIGDYTVVLTVTGPGGSDPETKVDYISVTSLVFTDDFNRAESDPIGAPWVTSPGHTDVAIDNVNRLKGSIVAAPGGGAYYDDSFGSNQYSQARIASMFNVGVCVRMSATEQSYYRFQVVDNTTATLGKYVTGTFIPIGAAIPGTYGSDDIIRLEVSGSTLTAFQNGIIIRTDTDSDVTDGFPGVRFFNSPTGRLDDWEGGSLP